MNGTNLKRRRTDRKQLGAASAPRLVPSAAHSGSLSRLRTPSRPRPQQHHFPLSPSCRPSFSAGPSSSTIRAAAAAYAIIAHPLLALLCSRDRPRAPSHPYSTPSQSPSHTLRDPLCSRLALFTTILQRLRFLRRSSPSPSTRHAPTLRGPNPHRRLAHPTHSPNRSDKPFYRPLSLALAPDSRCAPVWPSCDAG